MSEPELQPLTVTQFNEAVSGILSESLPYSLIEGEVTGLKIRQNKWISFDLKDATSILPCFGVVGQIMPELLEDGAVVRVGGAPRLYVPYGKYSFSVRTVEPVGEGALRKAFELLKKKLEAEGLFATERKRALPTVPTTIGIITSRDGAVIHDIRRTLANRWGRLKLVLAAIPVQGRDAANAAVNAIQYFNAYKPVDVIIVARGGGSYEDLATFNDEALARAIVASRIPVISAIGHESDVTIADLVADVRAPTPTGAAQLVVPDRSEFELRLAHQSQAMERTIRATIDSHRRDLHSSVHRFRQFFELQSFAIERIRQSLRREQETLHHSLTLHRQTVLNSRTQLRQLIQLTVKKQRQQLELAAQAIHSVDPAHILKQGYAMVRRTNDGVVESAAQVNPGEQIEIQMKDGTLNSWVIDRKDTPYDNH